MAVSGMFIVLGSVVLHWSRRRSLLPSVFFLVFLYAFMVDWTFPGRVAGGSGARWMTDLVRALSLKSNDRFLLLPPAKALSHREVRELVDIPLKLEKSSETDDWRSPSFHLPAGVYRLEGGLAEHIRLCNGQGCLSTLGAKHEFAVGVALAHFHVRSDSPGALLHLRAQRVNPSSVVAGRSIRLNSGVDVHGLDDHAYLDPKGFWVHAGAKAQFALEAVNGGSGRVTLANGGKDNWVVIEYQGQANQFLLQAWDKRTLELPLKEGVLLLSVTSTSGFRPSDLDSSSNDRRMLGILLTSG